MFEADNFRVAAFIKPLGFENLHHEVYVVVGDDCSHLVGCGFVSDGGHGFGLLFIFLKGVHINGVVELEVVVLVVFLDSHLFLLQESW